MYSSRLSGLVFLILASLVPAAWGQTAAPPAEPPAEAQETKPPEAQQAKPPEAQQAKPPEAQQAKPPEAQPAKPPAEDATPQAEAAKPEAKPAAKPAAEAAKPPAEKPAPRQTVAWNDEIAAVAGAKYPKTPDELRLLQDQVQAVVRYARPAVVAIQIGDSVGSGVIVNAEGLVLTAGHVAMQPNRPVIFRFPDGSKARGRTLGLNKSVDSGMAQLTGKGPWPFVPAAPAGEIALGEWVIGLGQPNGYSRDRQPPVRLGRVLFENSRVIKTDVTLVGGDSGGPLLNLKGQVVGIHSRIGSELTDNLHVPISRYERSWDRLVSGEAWGDGIGDTEPVLQRPFLGLSIDQQAPRCVVTGVFEGMSAQRRGVRVGDVIREFDGQPVANAAELTPLVLAKKPLARVELAIERDGKLIKIEVRLGRTDLDFPGAPPIDS